MLVNGKMHESVTQVWIDKDGMIDIVLDHNMLMVECMVVNMHLAKKKKFGQGLLFSSLPHCNTPYTTWGGLLEGLSALLAPGST